MSNDNKVNRKIIGSIIKLNRINQKISQKSLSKGICVPSYLSRIENGEITPSDDVISIIFTKLGLTFNDSSAFMEKANNAFNNFFHNLHFNEFDMTNKLFEEIESNETEFLTSPLIIDYFVAKLARYCATHDREKVEEAKYTLASSMDLLSAYQRFQYNFYVGVDMLCTSDNKRTGKEYIEKALQYKENGHCHFWLSYAYRVENDPIKAYDSIKKALEFYVAEGNLLSIVDCYAKIAEVHFMLDNYQDALCYLKNAYQMAVKLNNKHYIEPINSKIAWCYYRLSDFNSALACLSQNTGIVDHRMVIPDSVTECLIHFAATDKESLMQSVNKLKDASSLEQLDMDLSEKLKRLFIYYAEHENYLKSSEWGDLLISITESSHKLVELNKVFKFFLKNYYICNRKYKEALLL